MKNVGERIPFEPGEEVWDRVVRRGKMIVIEDKGGEVKVYGNSGETFKLPSAALIRTPPRRWWLLWIK